MRRMLRTTVRVLVIVVVVVALIIGNTWSKRPRPEDAPSWRRLANMPQDAGEVASAVAGGRLYVIGGLRGVTTTSGAIMVYDIDRDRWQRAEGSWPRHHAAAASVGRSVYVSGGSTSVFDWEPTDDVVRITPDGPQRIARMPEGRQGHAMVAVGDKLYVIGGVGRTEATLIYDVSEEAWSSGAPLPIGRDHLRAVAYRGEIWALGGRSGDEPITRVDIYDPERDRWRAGADLPQPMSAMSVGVVGDELHVVGGEDPSFFSGNVSADHVFSDSGFGWQKAPAPMLAVHGAGYGAHRGTLVIAGGSSLPGAQSPMAWTPVTQVYDP